MPGIEFWQEPTGVNMAVDILTSPSANSSLYQLLQASNIKTRVLIEDVGKKIDQTSAPLLVGSNYRQTLKSESLDELMKPKNYYKIYQRHSSYIEKINALQEQYPDTMSVETVGKSSEGRPLLLIKISKNDNTVEQKPVIFIDGLHHAREWISHSTVMYLLETFLGANINVKYRLPTNNQRYRRRSGPYWNRDNKSNSRRQYSDTAENDSVKRIDRKQIDRILDLYDIWMMPMVNPDGYEYSQTVDRLWRKSRSNGYFCAGVDLNRNYDFKWNVAGSSDYPCSQTYGGQSALSEPESRAVATQLTRNKDNIKMYLSFHAYSQLILTPWGYRRGYPKDYKEMERVANAGVKAFKSLRGTSYKFGTAANVLYPAAGCSDDYAYGVGNITYSYTIELPDTGNHGFLLPPSSILPVGRETLDAVTEMILAINEQN